MKEWKGRTEAVLVKWIAWDQELLLPDYIIRQKKKHTKKNLVLWELRLAAVPEIKHCTNTKVRIKSVTRCFSVEALVATSISSLVIKYLLLIHHIH